MCSSTWIISGLGTGSIWHVEASQKILIFALHLWPDLNPIRFNQSFHLFWRFVSLTLRLPIWSWKVLVEIEILHNSQQIVELPQCSIKKLNSLCNLCPPRNFWKMHFTSILGEEVRRRGTNGRWFWWFMRAIASPQYTKSQSLKYSRNVSNASKYFAKVESCFCLVLCWVTLYRGFLRRISSRTLREEVSKLPSPR